MQIKKRNGKLNCLTHIISKILFNTDENKYMNTKGYWSIYGCIAKDAKNYGLVEDFDNFPYTLGGVSTTPYFIPRKDFTNIVYALTYGIIQPEKKDDPFSGKTLENLTTEIEKKIKTINRKFPKLTMKDRWWQFMLLGKQHMHKIYMAGYVLVGPGNMRHALSDDIHKIITTANDYEIDNNGKPTETFDYLHGAVTLQEVLAHQENQENGVPPGFQFNHLSGQSPTLLYFITIEDWNKILKEVETI